MGLVEVSCLDGLILVYLDLAVIPSKWAAKSVVTQGRHFTVSLEGLLGTKNHQNKVRLSMKFHDINLFFIVQKTPHMTTIIRLK